MPYCIVASYSEDNRDQNGWSLVSQFYRRYMNELEVISKVRSTRSKTNYNARIKDGRTDSTTTKYLN